jgi:hypothetical protein
MALQFSDGLAAPSSGTSNASPDIMQDYSPIVRAGEQVLQTIVSLGTRV